MSTGILDRTGGTNFERVTPKGESKYYYELLGLTSYYVVSAASSKHHLCDFVVMHMMMP